jgi:hypothetical protein
MLLIQVLTWAALCFSVQSRKWHDTGKGSIIFEEAVTLPNLRTMGYEVKFPYF